MYSVALEILFSTAEGISWIEDGIENWRATGAINWSARPICQIVPTVRFRGKSRPVGVIEPIDTHDRD